MTCPTCGKETKTETRRDHAKAVKRGEGRDPMQRSMLAAGMKLHDIEVVEPHAHPTDTNAPSNPGTADDVRQYCKSCGWIGNWTSNNA